MIDTILLKHCEETLLKNKLSPLKKLGKGGFGVVYLVSLTDFQQKNPQYYSVKCTNKKQFARKPLLRRYLKQEIELLGNLQHQNIVRLNNTFEGLISNILDDGWIFMVMEYCNIGNISNIQIQKKDGIFNYEDASQILMDVIRGLQYMHSREIIHRDIKPQNVLRTKQKNKIKTKICDLGFSTEAKEDVDTFCGTTYYMAPELFMKAKYNYQVDIWAIGVLLFFMLFGEVPFKSLNMLNQITNKCQKGFSLSKMKKKHNPSIGEDQMKKLQDIFKGIFQLNPLKRLSLSEITMLLGNKSYMFCTTLTSKKSLQNKRTLESQNTDSSSEGSEQSTSFEADKASFISTVLIEVKELNFLPEFQQRVLEYYLDKICFELLLQDKKLIEEKTPIITHLKDRLENNYEFLLGNLHQCKIGNFMDIFTPKISMNFTDYKEQYRIVVGNAFYKAHKQIPNPELRAQIKLKLFCCHIINRVFENEYRKDSFPYFYDWLQQNHYDYIFDMELFSEWIETEKTKKISETIEIINNKFYKKIGK